MFQFGDTVMAQIGTSSTQIYPESRSDWGYFDNSGQFRQFIGVPVWCAGKLKIY